MATLLGFEATVLWDAGSSNKFLSLVTSGSVLLSSLDFCSAEIDGVTAAVVDVSPKPWMGVGDVHWLLKIWLANALILGSCCGMCAGGIDLVGSLATVSCAGMGVTFAVPVFLDDSLHAVQAKPSGLIFPSVVTPLVLGDFLS